MDEKHMKRCLILLVIKKMQSNLDNISLKPIEMGGWHHRLDGHEFE